MTDGLQVGARLPEATELLYRADPNLTAAIRVKEYLNRVPAPPEHLERVSVTKLVNPGQAYYDVVSPIEEEIAAFQKRMAGTGAHDRIERLLALPSEYWLDGRDVAGEPALDGVSAKLDSYLTLPDGTYAPIEIKNVSSTRASPPSYHLEQLGMYCAMLSSERGIIFRVHRNDATGESSLLPPLEVRFGDLGLVRTEMARRRDLLFDAVNRRDPSRLPACLWVRYPCKYREAGLCQCATKPPLDPVIAKSATWTEAPGFLDSLGPPRETPAPAGTPGKPPGRLSWFSLLTPRKRYFEAAHREDPKAEEASGGAGRGVSQVNKKGLESQVFAAIKGSNRSRVAHSEALGPGLQGAHLYTLDGNPFAVRVRMVANPIRTSAADVAGEWGIPQDVRTLAMQAALLHATGARAYVWNWKLSEESQKLQVFDLKFDPAQLDLVRAYVRDLPGRLERALQGKDPTGLPLCPRWMCERCPYLVECAPGP